MISNIIKSRRSISIFKSKQVSRKVIDNLLEVSSYAPSSCNTQPWFYLIFDTVDSKNKLKHYIKLGYDYTKKDIEKNYKVFGKIYIKLLNFFSKYGQFDNAPVYILLFARQYDTPIFSQAIKFSKNNQIDKIAQSSVETSSSMAMQNLLLIAHEKGLGTRVKDGIKFLLYFNKLKKKFYEEFNIPKEYKLISGIQLGYPTEESLGRKPSKRLPLSKIRRYI